MRNILANLKMPFDLRFRIFNCYVMPILLYGCENWILNQQQIERLEATEMWFIRRMQKISWKEKKTNEQVLRETIGKRKLIQKIVQRQVSFFGHVMRKGQLENIVTTAKINGKRKRGKPSIQYMDQIKKWTQQESIDSLMSKIYERTLLVAQVYWPGTQRRRRNYLQEISLRSYWCFDIFLLILFMGVDSFFYWRCLIILLSVFWPTKRSPETTLNINDEFLSVAIWNLWKVIVFV